MAGRSTPATAALTRAKIPFTRHEYPHNPKDESAQALGKIYCSAGRRGLEISLAPADLARCVGASFARLCS